MNSKKLLLTTAAVVIGFAFTGCGGAAADEGLSIGDGAGNTAPPTVAAPEVENGRSGENPGGPRTFASFVIDLVQNPSNDTEAVAIPEGLVDLEDADAFDVLFQ